MALIYQGGSQRPDWTQEQLTPYVTHKFVDGHTDWFFDTFLFYDFTDAWKVAFGYGYGTRYATKTDWEWLLNRVFEKGKSLDALDKCIEYYKGVLGEPNFRHKLVLGIVSPITGQTDWGSLDGKALDFNNQSDQVTAAKWYIDQLMSRFKENNYKNFDLIGFYWLEEDTAKCGSLPKPVSEYVHSLDKRFYWIPYWGAKGYDQWKELGFDIAFQQPNHFFNKDVIDSRLVSACKVAKQKGMGLEMEFDGKVLYENEDSYYSRLTSYINAFEQQGVFDNSPIAYYSGTRAILDMYLSPVVENTAILDRIANHIVQRHEWRATGINDVKENGPKAKAVGGIGEILIDGEYKDVQVYSINGTLISRGEKHLSCPAGLYIVRMDGNSQKVIVK